jgi:RNA polymerase sporulation-specific sigma factor
MLPISILLFLQSAFWSLRLGTGGGSFPRTLSAEEESKYLADAKRGDAHAREKLIEHNLRLVAHICKKYYSKAEHEDLISIGTIGLIKAVDSFNADKNTRLATYSAKCIENEILMHFRKERKQQNEVSLNAILDPDSASDGGIALIDVLPDNDTELLEELSVKENCKLLRTLLKTKLSKREANVLELRYGLSDSPPMTQSQVGEILRISRSYVSRIEKKAVEKLRESF